MTVTKFMDSSSTANSLTKFLDENDISVTKFLDSTVSKFLESNDITVTKFLEDKDDNDISVTKFL